MTGKYADRSLGIARFADMALSLTFAIGNTRTRTLRLSPITLSNVGPHMLLLAT